MQEDFLSDIQMDKRYGVHRSTIWRWVSVDLHFPKPVTISPGCTRWKASEIEAWETAKASKRRVAPCK